MMPTTLTPAVQVRLLPARDPRFTDVEVTGYPGEVQARLAGAAAAGRLVQATPARPLPDGRHLVVVRLRSGAEAAALASARGQALAAVQAATAARTRGRRRVLHAVLAVLCTLSTLFAAGALAYPLLAPWAARAAQAAGAVVLVALLVGLGGALTRGAAHCPGAFHR